jgi:hypothetical protein
MNSLTPDPKEIENFMVERSWVEMSCKGIQSEMLKQYFQANVMLDPFLLWDLQIALTSLLHG